MAPPVPRSRAARWTWAGVLVASVAFAALAPSRDTVVDPCHRCELDLMWCSYSWQSAEYHLEACRMDRERVVQDRKDRIRDAQELCEERVEWVEQTKAGELCWADVQKCQKQLDEEKKYYRWSLKFCGAIRDKTDREVAGYEKKRDELIELLDSDEREALEDD